jgi:long-chain acyl-CoA synthetase
MPFNGSLLSAPADPQYLLKGGLETHPNDAALISAETSWTWNELDKTVENLSTNLRLKGLKPGDRVAFLMPNRTHLLLLYLACFRAGFVAVPLNYRYTTREIDYALDVSQASMLIFHSERGEDVAASSFAASLPLGLLRYRPTDPNQESFEDYYLEPSEKLAQEKLDQASPAVIFFTSGSTGRPKGVTHSLESLGWMFASIAEAFELTSKDIMMPASSISHIGAFSFALAAISVAAKVVVVRAYNAEELLPLLRQERPTVLCMLPSALLPLVRDHDASKSDFASIRVCRSGSDKVPLELEKEFETLTGHKIDEGYGMSETGLSTLNPPSGKIKIGSIGTANPGFEMAIRDEDGKEVPIGEVGNLWTKSRCLMIGYWDNPEETAKAVHDGWIDSGDMMRRDEEDYLWFQGRKKQIIVHDGSNIFPQEVEESLLEHEAVESAGVIGIHDLLHGENVRAYVVVKENYDRPKVQELIDFCRARIGYKAPEEIEFLNEMPLNPTGKTDRVALKARASAHH